MTIEKNMLRERAKKLPDITEEMWQQVDPIYRRLMDEYLGSVSLSAQTKKQYTSGLRQFGWFVANSMNNKPLYKIKKRDALRYISYLRDDRKMSSSAINFKKSSVSAFCQWIENYVAEDEEEFETFRNFMQGLPPIVKNQVYDKVQVTRDDYDLMMKTLEDDEDYLGMAWLAVAFNVGARRSEILQFKTNILSQKIDPDEGFVMSHKVRGKGRGEDGKILEFMFNEEALKYCQLWIDKRGYENEYIFTVGNPQNNRQMNANWADYFCENTLSHILGRRINPHIFKASCITHLLDEGVDMKLVSEFVAHHESVETTQIYDLRKHEDKKSQIFKR